MPTEQSTSNGRTTSNGRKAKRRANSRVRVATNDVLDTDQLLAVLTAVRKGDFSVKMPMSQVGVAGKISDTLNDIIELNRETTRELERVSQAVGKEGKITQRAHLQGAAGGWAASGRRSPVAGSRTATRPATTSGTRPAGIPADRCGPVR